MKYLFDKNGKRVNHMVENDNIVWRIISDMSSEKLLFSAFFVAFYAIYALTAIRDFLNLGDTYLEMAKNQTIGFMFVLMVLILIALAIVLVLGVLLCAFLAVMWQSKFLSVSLQIFWAVFAAFSAWALIFIDFKAFLFWLLSALVHEIIVTVYKVKYVAKT